MQTNHHRFRILGISFIAILVLLTAGYLLLLKMIDLDTYKEQILGELRITLNRPVTYQNGSFAFSFGPAFSFTNVLIKEPDGSEDFVAIGRLTCRIDLLPLLRKQIVVHGIVAENPVIRLERYKNGTFNISDLLTTKSSDDMPLKARDIKYINGDVTFIDRFPQQEPLITRLTKVNMTLDNLDRAKKIGIKLTTSLGGGKRDTLPAGQIAPRSGGHPA